MQGIFFSEIMNKNIKSTRALCTNCLDSATAHIKAEKMAAYHYLNNKNFEEIKKNKAHPSATSFLQPFFFLSSVCCCTCPDSSISLVFPQALKAAVKKITIWTKTLMQNYRPISYLLFISKTIEKAVFPTFK